MRISDWSSDVCSSDLCRKAFDLGITHFDLANNYGPPPGSAETAFGEILKTDFAGYRDELIISSKAGYNMWPGPYGEWGSRKYLIDRKRGVEGKRVSVRVSLGGGGSIKKKTKKK